MDIKIEYDGAYPNLCSGDLKITIDGEVWEFPDYCLSSGGGIERSEDWDMWATEGPWSITEWPLHFPENLKRIVLSELNQTIDHGCCGGCI